MKATSEDFSIFVCVVASGSITAASQSLGLAASAVSRSLSRLEEKVGVTLLNRTTRRMHLTEEGALLFDQAKDILLRIEDLEERLTSRRQAPAGRLRVNATTAFMLHAIVPHLDEFRGLYPAIELQLNTSESDINLLAENTDIAIRMGAQTDSTLRARLLGTDRLQMVASPAYLARCGEPAEVADLAAHALIGFSEPASLNLWPLQGEAGAAFQFRPALSASSAETIRQLALAGHGIACLASFATARDVAAGRLVNVMSESLADPTQPVYAVFYRNSRLSLRIQCFLDFMQPRLRQALVSLN
ncbi:LysR family transcriptional regulator [Paraburkholderia acidisoli]|uniref:LysR family transcriptional regulator n=1 Tax=Paraburkholderia acidisoli TaxID=2571748 RepID=A0A7Z2GJN1_9BURK|nr:LysR family transcriptional regulator [Paraburkholderia acidisoli]QGZ63063.1 LysR family transcriptional regulator [Paraburkholderia acidisoli]